MKLSAPKKATWWVALIVLIVGAVLGIVSKFVAGIPGADWGVWLLLIAGLIYAIATAVKGL